MKEDSEKEMSSMSNVNPVDDDKEQQNENNENSMHYDKGKLLLTSNSTTKHVTFKVPGEKKTFANAEQYNLIIDNVEGYVKDNMAELRKYISSLHEAKNAMNEHIFSLEGSLIKSNENNRDMRSLLIKKEKENERLQKSLEESNAAVAKLSHEISDIQSDHSDHLQSIGKQQRRKRLAKRSVETWKKKLKSKNLCLVAQLKTENAFLKQELIVNQESTKQAFIRSANVLNSEVVTIFQNSTKRILNSGEPSCSCKEELCCSGNTSDDSNMTEDSSRCSGTTSREEQENEPNCTKNSCGRSKRKPRCDTCGDFSKIATKKLYRNTDGGLQQSDNAIKPSQMKYKPRLTDFTPHPLRNETRHIIQQLQSSNKKTQSPSQCECSSTPLNKCCSSCSSKLKLNLAKFPIDTNEKYQRSSPKSTRSYRSNSHQRNIVLSSMNKNELPVASAIVIERHNK